MRGLRRLVPTLRLLHKPPCLPPSASRFGSSQDHREGVPRLFRGMSFSPSPLAVEKQVLPENNAQQVELLNGVEDLYEGIIVQMEEPMDAMVFASLLSASVSQWRHQGKKAVWIRFPIRLINLVEAAVKEGFWFHHAEPDYLMLVTWLAESPNTIPTNASHRVGVGAFVMNANREVLVVQEKNGKFKSTGVWKFPTGVVNEGEDICEAAIREVKEETGIDTEFVEVLAFRQSHQSFFHKSDLFFVCMLRPCSSDIRKQDTEIEEAQWMRVEDYASQPFVQEHTQFDTIAKICLGKSRKKYSGFSPLPTMTSSGKQSYLYYSSRDTNPLPS